MTITQREKLLQSIAEQIADYRQGEIPPPTPEHVEWWVEQFERVGAGRSVQDEILSEIDHVLKHTYISKAMALEFLSELATTTRLVGPDPAAYWRFVNFLRLQEQGNSQADMLAALDGVLKEKFGYHMNACGSARGPFLYLDDCVFTGNRVRHDLIRWLDSTRLSTR